MIERQPLIVEALELCVIPAEKVQQLAYYWKFWLTAMNYRELYPNYPALPDRVVVDMVMQLNSFEPDESRTEWAQDQLRSAYAQVIPYHEAGPRLSAFFAVFDRHAASRGIYSAEYLAAEGALADLLGGRLIVTRGELLAPGTLDEKGDIRQEVLDADRLREAVKKATISERELRFLAGLWRYLALCKLSWRDLHDTLMEDSKSKENETLYDLISDDGVAERVRNAERQLYLAYLMLFDLSAATSVTELLRLQEDLAFTASSARKDEQLSRAKAAVNRHTGPQLDITSGNMQVVD